MARKKDGSLAPAHSAKDLLGMFPEVKEIADLDYEFIVNIDSTNMHPGIWTKLAAKIKQKYADYDGFVITHGTDTMAFTASALSFALQNLSKPIVLTGAQKPPSDIASDAKNNLLNAVQVATLPIPEVCIVFGTEILRGNRTQKRSEVKLNAFWSPVALPLGAINLKPELINGRIYRSKSARLKYKLKFDPQVMFYQIFPGLSPKYVDMAIKNNCRGIILNSYGAGNVPNLKYSLIPVIKKAVEKNIPVVITTQCVEGSAQMLLYEVGYAALKAGAISGLDMTAEAAVTKLMWVLAQTKDMKKIKRMMQTNYAGEITLWEWFIVGFDSTTNVFDRLFGSIDVF